MNCSTKGAYRNWACVYICTCGVVLYCARENVTPWYNHNHWCSTVNLFFSHRFESDNVMGDGNILLDATVNAEVKFVFEIIYGRQTTGMQFTGVTESTVVFKTGGEENCISNPWFCMQPDAGGISISMVIKVCRKNIMLELKTRWKPKPKLFYVEILTHGHLGHTDVG